MAERKQHREESKPFIQEFEVPRSYFCGNNRAGILFDPSYGPASVFLRVQNVASRPVCSGPALSNLLVWVDLVACKESLLHLLGLFVDVVYCMPMFIHPGEGRVNKAPQKDK